MNVTENEAMGIIRDTMSAVCEICHDRYEIDDVDLLPDICSCCAAKDKVIQLVMMCCKTVGTREDLEASFEAFWKVYSKYKDEDKKKAKKVWMRIKPDADLVKKIMDAVAVQSTSEKWQRGYAPYASTWLNGERWNDTIKDPKQSAGKYRTGANAGYAQRQFDEKDVEGIFLDLD